MVQSFLDYMWMWYSLYPVCESSHLCIHVLYQHCTAQTWVRISVNLNQWVTCCLSRHESESALTWPNEWHVACPIGEGISVNLNQWVTWVRISVNLNQWVTCCLSNRRGRGRTQLALLPRTLLRQAASGSKAANGTAPDPSAVTQSKPLSNADFAQMLRKKWNCPQEFLYQEMGEFHTPEKKLNICSGLCEVVFLFFYWNVHVSKLLAWRKGIYI